MKIGLGQIDIVWEDKEANKNKCKGLIEEAAKKGCDLIVFPEMCLTGFSMNVDGIVDENAEDFNWFKDHAVKNNISIGFGFVEKDENGKGRNEFPLIGRDGNEVFRYVKTHLFPLEEEDKFYQRGEQLFSGDVEGTTTSPFICYDLRFPGVFQAVSDESQLLIVIANWPKIRREHWMTLLKARAIENQAYVVGVNRVGLGSEIEYCGDSMVVDPLGEVMSHLGDKEGLLEAEINPDFVEKVRKNFKFKADKREELYYKTKKRDHTEKS